MRDDAVYLRHIAEYIRRIEKNAAGGREEFLTSDTVQDATLRNLQTMSEATQHLSETARLQQPEVEWSKIAAFRNVLVHNYLGIDLELVWKVIENDLPELKLAVAEMLENTTNAES
ncbi:MAG: HepT-like ribonuclease domain-containing protein [Pyrinomonadaceae bacterium]